MGTRGFLMYLTIFGFSLAILCIFFLDATNTPSLAWSPNPNNLSSIPVHLYKQLSSSRRVWPELKFGWRSVLATFICFLGSAFGTVGGVGGGGIFVPMLNLIVGFDTKSSAALSKCIIMGASASSVWYNLRVPHPSKEVPIIDYDLAFFFQPVLLLGITIGVTLSVAFPFWLVTILIVILFLGTSSRSFCKGIEMWKQETIFKKELQNQQHESNVSPDTDYHILSSREEKSALETMKSNLRWKRVVILVSVWVAFLLLQIIKNKTVSCSILYWVVNALQIPIAILVSGYEAVRLWRENKKRKMSGNSESVCEATIEWTPLHIASCALCGIVGGIVGGLLGSGGGFVLGPLLLELGVIPQVASATATFVMMFSSSLSVVEFYLLKRFPIPYALYLISVSVIAGFWGQFFVRKLVTFFGRASIIVFILSAVIFASALTMGVAGAKKSFNMIEKHDYMGFLSICDRN
ncbi:hypothetical protein Scep_005332 [Stephania cephalantha]|uniref:Sulfite exporter TauE/SafE family protein n=1 Tax=Stephania cephalantha TaxID=152367 RepID=A0AAP0KU33_9MAGN